MATLSDLYGHLKTLCEQWFYNKSTMDTYLQDKISKSNTVGLVKNDGSIDTNTYSTTSHTHGNISADGKVGSNANYFVTTTTGGAVTSKQKVGNITTSGAIGSTANKPLITTTSGVITTGSFGTAANTFAEGNHNHTGTYAPLSHEQSSSTITDSNTYSHINNSSANQESINSAIDTAIGNLSSIQAINIVTTLPSAAASTMGKLYIISEVESGVSKINVYYTEDKGASASPRYAWHKMDADILDSLSLDWDDIDNKPNTFTPSSHDHGYIENDGSTSTAKTLQNFSRYDIPIISDLDDGGKLKGGFISTDYSIDHNTHTNIGSSANAVQSTINTAIDTALSNKASSTHSHGNILSGGTITTDVAYKTSNNYGKLVITNTSNQVGTISAIDVWDEIVQQLIAYGAS